MGADRHKSDTSATRANKTLALSPPLRRTFALLNAQWRGGSTLAEQLLFSTTVAPPFLLDEPAKAIWRDDNHHTAASANFNAFRCDFHQFNHSMLLSWQHWRGEFTRQRRLLNFKSVAELQKRCRSSGSGGHLRAIKTIRMSGELSHVARECIRHQHTEHTNFSCVLIQLVRHPLATLKSELASSRLRQTRGDKPEHAMAGAAPFVGTNLSDFCAPILRDVKTVLALQRRAAKAARRVASLSWGGSALAPGEAGQAVWQQGGAGALKDAIREAATVPTALLLRYDELLRSPKAAVSKVHNALHVFTSAPKLNSFIKKHLEASNTSGSLASALGSTNASTHEATHANLRKRLYTEFGTVRPARSCSLMHPMDEWPACAELLRRMHPLFLC